MFLFFFIFRGGKGDSSGNAIPEEWQLNCNLREILTFLGIFGFFTYIYNGVGDSSGNAIPEEWQLVFFNNNWWS